MLVIHVFPLSSVEYTTNITKTLWDFAADLWLGAGCSLFFLDSIDFYVCELLDMTVGWYFCYYSADYMGFFSLSFSWNELGTMKFFFVSIFVDRWGDLSSDEWVWAVFIDFCFVRDLNYGYKYALHIYKM